jgi:tetratricopeptide (TPR) repeat protein
MIYTMTTGISYSDHLDTQRTIRDTGRRIETAVHSGMMSLATSQAKAMKELGVRIDDRLVQFDDTLMAQSGRLDLIQRGLRDMNQAIANSFAQVDQRLSGIEGRLGNIERSVGRIETNTANPERTRALERFKRAQSFYLRGETSRALDAVDEAIANDGGQPFDDIPSFYLFKADIYMSAEAVHIDPVKAQDSLLKALTLTKEPAFRRSICISLGHAAYAARNPAQALQYFEAAAEMQSSSDVHFFALRAALHAEKPVSGRRHLRAALEANWNMLIVVAADTDCIAFTDIVEPVLREFTATKKAEIQAGLASMSYILREVYPTLEQLSMKLERSGVSRNYNIIDVSQLQRDRVLNEEEMTKLEWLAETSELGLLDFRPELQQLNSRKDSFGYNVAEVSLRQTYRALVGLWNKCEEVREDVVSNRVFNTFGMGVRPALEVPTPLEASGLSGMLGLSTSKQREREAEIAQVVAENLRRVSQAKQALEAMNTKILPVVREARSFAWDALVHHSKARHAVSRFGIKVEIETFGPDPVAETTSS